MSFVMPLGRNDPCPCGSGKKYKKCHLEADALAQKLKEDAGARPRILLHRDDPVAQMIQQNKGLERQVGRVRYLAAERATVVVQTPSGVRKLCSLQFSRKGGVFAHFPYFESKNGLLNALGYDAPARGSTTINFAEGGKTVSHDVKYSHVRCQ